MPHVLPGEDQLTRLSVQLAQLPYSLRVRVAGGEPPDVHSSIAMDPAAAAAAEALPTLTIRDSGPLAFVPAVETDLIRTVLPLLLVHTAWMKFPEEAGSAAAAVAAGQASSEHFASDGAAHQYQYQPSALQLVDVACGAAELAVAAVRHEVTGVAAGAGPEGIRELVGDIADRLHAAVP